MITSPARAPAILAFLVGVVAVHAPNRSSAAAPAPAPWLDGRVRAEVANFSGTVQLYARNLETGATYSLDGEERVRTASTIKIAVMIEAFARVAEARAKWSDTLLLSPKDKVSGSGILTAFDDGLHLTFHDAVNLMMMLSDNSATNLVIDVLTADAVNARMQSLGLTDTRLMRKIGGGGDSEEGRKEENKRFGIGRSSPREMVLLMEKLERGEVVSGEASKAMIALMKREQGTNGIWRALWTVPKATKSGSLDRLRSNVGILYHPRGRIALAITCDDMPQPIWTVDNPGLLLMSRVSELVLDGLTQ